MSDRRNQIVLVNEKDEQIWIWEKMEVHQKGELHRAISVIIFNQKGEMLLQKRAIHKYHCWWLRSNAVCTHPFSWETPLSAAQRRLQEELGFTTSLQEIFQFIYEVSLDHWLTEHEYDHVFIWFYEWSITINEDEVDSIRHISISTLERELKEKSEIFTPRFKIIFQKFIPHLKDLKFDPIEEF